MIENYASIILPIKDEPSVQQLINDLEWTLQYNDEAYEIIVVDSDKAKKHQTFPSHIKYYLSYGDSLERAILLGFSVAKGDKLIVMDADYSHLPACVLEMLCELDTHDMVVASRFIKDSLYLTSVKRYFVTRFFNWYAKLLGSTLSDPMSGYFGVRSHLLTRMNFKPYKWKTALEINNKLRPSTKEVPYTFQSRQSGKSKSNWALGIRILYDILVGAL